MSAGSAARGRPRALLIAVHSAAAGGAQAMALAQAEVFAERCEVIAAVPDGPLRERFAACAEVVGPTPTLPTWAGVSRSRRALQRARSYRDAVRLAGIARRRGVDAILTSSTVTLAPTLAARLARVPSFVHAREWPVTPAALEAFALQRRHADRIVAISAGVAGLMPEAGRAEIVQIPDGITAGPPPRSEARLAGPLRLCVIGALTAGDGKGQHRAVEALAELVAGGVEATLSVVGPVLDRDYADRVEAIARERGVAERVEMTGPVDDVPTLLEAHDALLFCSRQGADVTPLVIMEALVAGRPVVAADVGSVAEVMPDSECGYLVAPEDPAAMARAIATLAADPEEALARARRGAARIREHYDRRAGIERLWEEIVATGIERRAQVRAPYARSSGDRSAPIDR
jgi:glycosyltransferase involved in cell wall biosynthesis